MDDSLYDQYLKEQGDPQTSAVSPGSLYAQYLASQGQPHHDFHAEYKSGALAKRMAGANARDVANLKDEQDANGETRFDPIASHLANVAEGIPGVEAAQTYVRSKATGEPFGQARTDLRESAGGINPVVRYAERMAGAAPLAAILPGSPAVAGATLGGADAAFSPDNESLGRRAFNTALGAGVGGIVGKASDVGITAVKALRTPNPQANLIARQAARAASAVKLYGAAQSEGERNGANTAVRQFIQEPEIAQRIEALQSLEQYKNIPAESPEMMRALARSMSDEANTIGKGLSVTDPSKPNTLRDKAQSLGLTKQRLISVVSDPSVPMGPQPPGVSISEPAMMPSFRRASEDFAQKSADIDALRKGMFALQGESGQQRPTPNNISAKNPKTKEAFANLMQTGGPNGGPLPASQVQAAREGVLGDLSNAWRYEKQGVRMAPFRHDAATAAKLLRTAPTSGQSLTDLLQALGLTSLNSPFANR